MRTGTKRYIGTALDGAGDAKGCDLHEANYLTTRMEVQLGIGKGIGYFNLKSVEQRDHFRRTNSDVAARIERVLGREMERSLESMTRLQDATHRIAAVLV